MKLARMMLRDLSEELSAEELIELELAEARPVSYDPDCPEMTEEQLKQFHRVHAPATVVSA